MLLEPELVEYIAAYIACPTAWLAFLTAMPRWSLRRPVQSLLRLYPSVLQRGPRLVLSKIAPEHVDDIRAAMPLYTVVELSDWTCARHAIDVVVPSVDVEIANVKSSEILSAAMASWPLQLVACKVDIGPEVLFSSLAFAAACAQLRDSCPRLASLDLCWQRPMAPAEQDALVAAICASSSLTHLRIASFMAIVLTDDNTRHLAKWLETSCVHTIAFESVAFSLQSESAVCHALRRHVPTLQSLKLAFTPSLARALLNGRRLPKTLPKLEIVGSIETVDIAPSMAAMMAESLAESHLTHCTLSSNHCLHNPSVASLIFGALPHMAHLQHLNLTYNGLDTVACEVLATALPNMRRLESLNVENNFLRDVGCAILSTALPNCVALQTLHLGHNFIGDVGVRALCMAVRSSTSLSTLTLGGNELTAVGATQLARLVQDAKCPTLTTLDVALNPHLQVDGVLRLLHGVHQSSVQLTVSGLALPPRQLRKCVSLIEQLELPATLLT
ncbi:hypothetical protein SPRG_01640 [Saprolegnia parasitica CBS 223.65]|uniref:F-box domain-containing protein n=1 Tax=Saprolegnia parasitica (strain CBS 223.65) TaxID=695850 RepID=A0A067CSU9_SAPPC|nr:hypothetical protein SPRG_01640 [Saprolegnia parasitica CBS 223.65]KDO33759.1 hypothetical protein SPRG_01640 [Saprolegnia parasitica CBS 223.65]|eukprot:XP_012195397.1 hypothetical protein SPRG_01640 [Saprolegnia parasitica CBS 223.65]